MAFQPTSQRTKSITRACKSFDVCCYWQHSQYASEEDAEQFGCIYLLSTIYYICICVDERRGMCAVCIWHSTVPIVHWGQYCCIDSVDDCGLR